MPYFAQADLENALGKNTVAAIFDDDGDTVADAAPVAACLAYGTSECDSFLRANYAVTFPINPVPDELKFAAVDFGCAYAVRRRPDVTRAMGEKSWDAFRDAAIEKMKRFADSMQRLPDTVAAPANVGGFTVDDSARIAVSGADGTVNMGDF